MTKDTQSIWEEEYTTRRLMSGTKPIKAVVKWTKHIIKQGPGNPETKLEGVRILDLGSGEGKHAIHVAERGAQVACIEIARNAIETFRERARDRGLLGCGVASGSTHPGIAITQGSIGEPYSFADDYFDAIIDITASNSLSESERAVYLRECYRVLRDGGSMMVRALSKDGDNNAKQLLEKYPGGEYDTYVVPGWGQRERVFSEYDIRKMYGKYFEIQHIEKETHYSTWAGRRFKRKFWVMYLRK